MKKVKINLQKNELQEPCCSLKHLTLKNISLKADEIQKAIKIYTKIY